MYTILQEEGANTNNQQRQQPLSASMHGPVYV